MPVRITPPGPWGRTEIWLKKLQKGEIYSSLEKYGAMGVAALSAATPTGEGTGATAESWTYEIVQREGYYSIRWFNTNVNKGQQVAILLQYGHGTGTGGYVQGQDYINPAMRPIFDQIEAEVRKVVSS